MIIIIKNNNNNNNNYNNINPAAFGVSHGKLVAH